MPHASPPPVDVTAVIQAVRFLATSMSTMADRIRELEAHVEAFATSNDELEANNRQLTIEVGEVVQERERFARSLAAESERFRQLERFAALGIARATALNRDLSAAHADLAGIVDAVGSRLAADASASAEVPGRTLGAMPEPLQDFMRESSPTQLQRARHPHRGRRRRAAPHGGEN